MSANIYERFNEEQKKGIQDVLKELSEAAISLDPERIKEARETFMKAMEEQQ